MGNSKPKRPPSKIIDAVKLIEKWTSKQTKRDDWAIGGVACRAGFERLLEMYNNLKSKK